LFFCFSAGTVLSHVFSVGGNYHNIRQAVLDPQASRGLAQARERLASDRFIVEGKPLSAPLGARRQRLRQRRLLHRRARRICTGEA
jgi:hypothetical protein